MTQQHRNTNVTVHCIDIRSPEPIEYQMGIGKRRTNQNEQKRFKIIL